MAVLSNTLLEKEREAEKWKSFFTSYVANDLKAADVDYVRCVLKMIGCGKEDLTGTTLEYLFTIE